jgi:hypothetical protein
VDRLVFGVLPSLTNKWGIALHILRYHASFPATKIPFSNLGTFFVLPGCMVYLVLCASLSMSLLNSASLGIKVLASPVLKRSSYVK